MEDKNNNTFMDKFQSKQDYTDAVENVLEDINSVTDNFIDGTIDANSAVEQNKDSYQNEDSDHKTLKYVATAVKEEELDLEEPTRSESEPEAEIAKMKDSSLTKSAKSSLVSIESSSSPNVFFSELIFLIFALNRYCNC